MGWLAAAVAGTMAGGVARAAAPTVDNSTGATVSVGRATLWGNLTSTGGLPTTVTTYWGDNDGDTDPLNWDYAITNGVLAEGTFSSNTPSTLLYGQRYHYRCYATNADGGAWAPATTNFVTASGMGWSYTNWTGDADSGISNAYTYTAAHCFGDNHANVTVNGVTFSEGFITSGAGWSIAGAVANWGGDDDAAVTGSSEDLAEEFVYNGNPRTVQLSGLASGVVYRTTFFSAAWETGSRVQMFASGGDSTNINQDAYNNNNGITISYVFKATNATQDITITPQSGNTFHLYALANRVVFVLANSPATGVATTSAVLNATLVCTGAVYDVTAYWNTVNGGTNAGLWTNSAPVGSWTNVGSTNLSCMVTGLTPYTVYFFTFRATNAVEDLWETNALSFGTFPAAEWLGGTGGADHTNDWDVAPNWISGAVPGANTAITLGTNGSSGIVDLNSSNPSVVGIAFRSAVNTTIRDLGGSPGHVGLARGGVSVPITVEGGSHAIAAGVELGDNALITVSAGTLTLSGAVGESAGGKGVAKSGAGTLTLSGANTYSGETIPNGGILQANHATALGSGGDITFGGGTLQFGSALNNTTVNWGARVKNSASAISLDANGQSVTISGDISAGNTGGLTKSGAGTLTLTGANVYSGATTISAGTLQIGDGASATAGAGTGALSVGANALVLNLNAPVTLGNASVSVGAGGSITNIGSGKVTLNNAAGGVGNGCTLDGGSAGLVLPTRTTVGSINIYLKGDVWVSTDQRYTSIIAAGPATLHVNNNITSWCFYGPEAYPLNVDAGSGTTSTYDSWNGSTAYLGNLTGAGDITLTGGNRAAQPYGTTWILGTSTLSGTLTCTEYSRLNPVFFGNGGATGFAGPTRIVNNLNQVNAGRTPSISGVYFNCTTDNTYSGLMSGTGNVFKQGTNTLIFSNTNNYSGITTISQGTLQLGDGVSSNGAVGGIITNDASLVFANPYAHTNSGVIRGSGTLTKTGAGTLTLAGVNTYTGDTRVNAGTLSLNNACLCDTAAVTIAGGAKMNLNFAGTDTIAALSLGGTFQSPGVYGASALGPGYFTGSGTLTVTNGAPPTAIIFLFR